MSTSYIPRKPIKFEDVAKWSNSTVEKSTKEINPFVREGTENFGIEDEDGNFLRVYRSGQNAVFKRWGRNNVEKILARIEEQFKTEIISEHEDDYWNLSTVEDYPDGNFYI